MNASDCGRVGAGEGVGEDSRDGVPAFLPTRPYWYGLGSGPGCREFVLSRRDHEG